MTENKINNYELVRRGQTIMDNNTRKEQEREELHRSIWSIANSLRGAVDGWDFKQYVLGIMFYRYISENLASYINKGERDAGKLSFDYSKISDAEAEVAREGLVNSKGFFILPSELFCNVRAKAYNDENLNETLESVFKHIEESAKGTESENDFTGLFEDIDVNSNKLGSTVEKRNKKISQLLNDIGDMKLGDYQDNTIDAFGDAYEYLMGMYASNAGKSGGEYFTPQEVSELLTRLAIIGKTSVNKVYDPACGSGSLLLQSLKLLGKDNIKQGFYGQEKNITTYNLCRINMFLHDVDFDKFSIACEDTLLAPKHWDDEPFDVIVSNPPYSIKWDGDDNPLLINDIRFSPAGVLAPKGKADLAFIMHSLSWLSTNGVASIVCFPGIMYRGGAEQKIRKYLVDNNYIDCIIQLPDNLFFGTSIATCILVLKKSKNDTNILFIDASKECVKVTNNNKLTPYNIQNIVKVYKDRIDKDYMVKVASYEDVKNNDYNLSVSTYVVKEDTREQIDIKKLNTEIEEIVARENELREEINKIIKEIENE
ncbi:MAG: putative type I restriction enzymeP M protein [Firmicutes bacterium ADurb.Bin080]|nr:MAG: putative type I restriction enzymeP M protein [Firmicutes bacterium ADurb.Bin080]